MLTRDVKSLAMARDELQQSFDKSYELYNYLLKFIIDITDLQDLYLDEAKHKFLPTHEDLNPNPKFVDNELVEILRNNEQLQQFIKEHKLSWRDNELFLRLMLNKIQNTDVYNEYMESGMSDLDSDCNLWRQLFRRLIIDDDDMLEELENKSVYWSSDDLDFMGQFVIKTIRRISDGEEFPIMPQFKDEEDAEFGDKLFTAAVEQEELNSATIDKFVDSRHWDSDRIQSGKCYDVICKHQKPVVVMEPIKGGTLVNVPDGVKEMFRQSEPNLSVASWAIRFAASQPQVMMVLSGMSTYEQLDDNTSYMQDFKPLTEEQMAITRKAADILNGTIAVPCTSCRYCVKGCPQHIAIPEYFSLYNAKKRFNKKGFTSETAYYNNLIAEHGKASDCIQCRKCERICPQHIEISEVMKKVAKEFEG